MTTSKLVAFPFIDGLRALAVLAVVVYHLKSTWLPGGLSGVDIFFVISGFVVSWSSSAYINTSLREFAAWFYTRRVLRIFPALLVCILMTTLFIAFFIPDSKSIWIEHMTGQFALVGLSNFALAFSNGSYFLPISDFNGFTQTWSLAVEEQFYLFFPLLFFFLQRNRRISENQKLFAFGFTILVSLLLAFHFRGTTGSFFMLPTRFWEIGAGILLFKLTSTDTKFKSAHNNPWTELFFSGLLIGGFLFATPSKFPWPWSLVPVVGTFGLIYTINSRTSGKSLIKSILSSRLMIRIGKLSYSIYLWHWPVIVLFRWTVGIDSVLKKLIAVMIFSALAVLSYQVVEKPIRYSDYLRVRLPRFKLGFATLLLIAVCFGITTLIFSNRQGLTLSNNNYAGMWLPYFRDHVATGNCDPIISTLATGSESFFIDGRPCSKEVHSQKLFVIGDSHAFFYSALLQQLAADRGLQIELHWLPDCGPFIDFVSIQSLRPPACRAKLTNVLNSIKAGDLLFLASLRLKKLSNDWNAEPDDQTPSLAQTPGTAALTKDSFEDAKLFLQPIADRGVRILFEYPPPIFRTPVFRCADWFNSMNPACRAGFSISQKFLLGYRQPVVNSIDRLKNELPHVFTWDPFPILCPDKNCDQFMQNKPIFFDSDHLSGFGNDVLTESLGQRIFEIFQTP